MNAKFSIGSQITTRIDGMDDEGRGRGLAENDQSVDVAVRGAFPGDRVAAVVEKIFPSRALLICRAVKHLEKGVCHVERKCPHPLPCPTCPLHGADPSLALELKRSRIERALIDGELDLDVDDVMPHPHEFGYRQKVKLMVGGSKGNLTIGAYVPYSHHLVAAHACPYVHPSINQALQHLIEELNKLSITPDSSEHPGLRAVVLRTAQEGIAAILISAKPLTEECFKQLSLLVDHQVFVSLTEKVTEEQTNSIIGGKIHRHTGKSLITPLEGGPVVDPDSFCQTDALQAKHMYRLAAEFLTEETKSGWFVDAYAGVGGFSRALIEQGANQILAIEQAPSSQVSLAQLNVRVEIKPMSDAMSILRGLSPLSGIVVDPPKKGLMQEAIAIAELDAPRVVLVSCDPDAMARDLKIFVNHGYIVDRILPIDLFGGAPAIETVVFMKK